MAGPSNDLATNQAIHDNFIEWLQATGRDCSNFNGVLFARQITSMGNDVYEGMTQDEICRVLGCDPLAAELF